jgi:acetoin utilization protein AcuC
MRKAALICSHELWTYGHGDAHPLRPERLRMTYELLEAYGAWDGEGSLLYTPSQATEDELALWHTPDYIDAVRRLGAGDQRVSAYKYHFAPGDNPVFPGMYESEALKAGATLLGARLVLEREVDVAFSFAGGMHHAMPDYASGFCVFNDPAIACQWLANQGARVVYVDVDAHHGDGVQAAFYDDPRVMTISLHESGRYLFPGTGFVEELGSGPGEGTSVNLPLFPYTEDEVYWYAFHAIVPPLVERFAPDVLVTQLGTDTHYLDPLTHLQLTTAGYTAVVQALRDMDLPWLATGGGGYHVSTVARSWALAYGIMSDQRLPDRIPDAYAEKYGDEWLHDRQGPVVPPRYLDQARAHAESTVGELQRALGL